MTKEFTKRWDKVNGFNEAEAMMRKKKIDEAHEVNSLNSKWNPAEIVPDQNKKNGYKIVISTKDSPR